MTSFTYTLTSYDNILGINQANNVKISANGFPTEYKYFKCKVLNFNLNYQTLTANWKDTKLFYLISDNLVYGDRPSCSNRASDIIANTAGVGGLNNNNGTEFIVANLDGKTVNFQVVDHTFTNIAGNMNVTENTAWVLSLLITPIENDPNNYQLRYGL